VTSEDPLAPREGTPEGDGPDPTDGSTQASPADGETLDQGELESTPAPEPVESAARDVTAPTARTAPVAPATRASGPARPAASGHQDDHPAIDDPVSKWWVGLMVAVFLVILAYGALFGTDGLLHPGPTPLPTVEPIPSESSSASPSVVPSASVVASPTTAASQPVVVAPSPSAVATVVPSPSLVATLVPSPSPSPTPTPSSTPSPTPTPSPSPVASPGGSPAPCPSLAVTPGASPGDSGAPALCPLPSASLPVVMP
jgi:hypothetical protein